jgi:hypothetical protein
MVESKEVAPIDICPELVMKKNAAGPALLSAMVFAPRMIQLSAVRWVFASNASMLQTIMCFAVKRGGRDVTDKLNRVEQQMQAQSARLQLSILQSRQPSR